MCASGRAGGLTVAGAVQALCAPVCVPKTLCGPCLHLHIGLVVPAMGHCAPDLGDCSSAPSGFPTVPGAVVAPSTSTWPFPLVPIMCMLDGGPPWVEMAWAHNGTEGTQWPHHRAGMSSLCVRDFVCKLTFYSRLASDSRRITLALIGRVGWEVWRLPPLSETCCLGDSTSRLPSALRGLF